VSVTAVWCAAPPSASRTERRRLRQPRPCPSRPAPVQVVVAATNVAVVVHPDGISRTPSPRQATPTALARRPWTARTTTTTGSTKSRFLLRLVPRTRRPESDTAECLMERLEGLLVQVQESKGMFAPVPAIRSLAAHVDTRAGPFVQALPVLTLRPPSSTPSSLAQDSKSPAPSCGTWKALPAPGLRLSLRTRSKQRRPVRRRE
jgi:hypothetical protein